MAGLLVESDVRTFGWSYERGMQNWARAAKNILDLQEKISGTDKKLIVIKYEDIYLDEKLELTRIFDWLNVDPEKYQFEHAKNIGITGSSELKKKEGKVHWKVIQKDKNFNPLNRAEKWSKRRQDRFNWIAGKYMRALVYKIEKKSYNQFFLMKNKIYDFIWNIRKSIEI